MNRNCALALGTRSQAPNLFEQLEQRTMMASTLTIKLKNTSFGPSIVVDTTSNNDKLTVTQDSKGVIINDGKKATRVNKNTKAIVIDGHSGDDLIVVDKSVKANVYINGGKGNDTIIGGSGRDTIVGGIGNDWISGGNENDVLKGEDGNDSLFGGAGKDALVGGFGDDVLVAVGGGGSDSLLGERGTDSFWLDDTANEKVYDTLNSAESYTGAVHKIGKFLDFVDMNGKQQTISKELNGQNLPDPERAFDTNNRYMGDGYANFYSKPLFNDNGPMADDVHQGAIGTCYFLSTVSGIAALDPQRIRQSVVDLGDGTFAVRFFETNGEAKYVRVDADLPVYKNKKLAYANTGPNNAIWVPIMEKAYCYFRNLNNATNPVVNTSYHNIEYGFMDEVPTAMGADDVFATTPGQNPFSNGYQMLGWIQSELNAGRLVTFGTLRQAFGGFVESHAYTVVDVQQGQDGEWYVLVRNPWATDGHTSTDGKDDGYLWVSAGNAFRSMMSIQSSWV